MDGDHYLSGLNLTISRFVSSFDVLWTGEILRQRISCPHHSVVVTLAVPSVHLDSSRLGLLPTRIAEDDDATAMTHARCPVASIGHPDGRSPSCRPGGAEFAHIALCGSHLFCQLGLTLYALPDVAQFQGPYFQASAWRMPLQRSDNGTRCRPARIVHAFRGRRLG